MIPDPDTITVELASDTVLFPRDDALNQLFPLKNGCHEFDYFAGLWELPDRKRRHCTRCGAAFHKRCDLVLFVKLFDFLFPIAPIEFFNRNLTRSILIFINNSYI